MEKVLPKGWVEGNISGFIHKDGLFKDGDWIESKDQDVNGDVRLIQLADIGVNEFRDKSNRFLTSSKAVELKCTLLKKNDILIARMPDPIGRSCVFPLSGKFATVVDVAIVRLKESIFNPFLFSHFINSPEIQKHISELASGSTRQRISRKNLDTIPIPLPPLSEQERIITKLDNLFAQHDKIKNALDRIPQLLKDFRQQILTQAVAGKLTTVSVLENKLISDFFDVKTGATPKKGVSKYYENASIPWIKSGEVRNSFIHEVEEFISETAIKETNAKIFPKDTILIAMYGEGKTRGQVGWMKTEAATNQAIAALVNEDLNESTREYIYLYCLSQYNEIRSKAEGGNQPNLNLSKIKNWNISIPIQIEEQKEIVRRVEGLLSKADTIEKRYIALKEKVDTLPQAILHRAFKGELVPQLPTDGNAKDLLEEILALNKEVKGKKKKK